MGSLSIWHWLIVGAVLLLVFGGRGKISDMMGDVAKGIKAFKKGMSDEDDRRRVQIRRADEDASIIRRPADVKRRAEAESKVSYASLRRSRRTAAPGG